MVDRNKLNALLEELRSWEPGAPAATVRELADRFGLPPVVIQQVARSEGLQLSIGEVRSDDSVSERADTLPFEKLGFNLDLDD